MKDLELHVKSVVLTMRSLTILMIILLMIYGHQGLSFSSRAYLSAVNFVLTNIVLAFIPRQKFERPITASFIMAVGLLQSRRIPTTDTSKLKSQILESVSQRRT